MSWSLISSKCIIFSCSIGASYCKSILILSNSSFSFYILVSSSKIWASNFSSIWNMSLKNVFIVIDSIYFRKFIKIDSSGSLKFSSTNLWYLSYKYIYSSLVPSLSVVIVFFLFFNFLTLSGSFLVAYLNSKIKSQTAS